MSLYSAAQSLPLHVVKCIVSYVVWNNGVVSDMDKTDITDSNRKDLLILMKVCHHWRSIAQPLYYCSADILLYDPKISYINKSALAMLDLDKVSENKSQHHVQSIYFLIGSSALVKPEASIKTLRDTVHRCGQLKRAQTVLLDFRFERFKEPYNPSQLYDVTVVDSLERTCAEYARLLNELLPNKRRLYFQSTDYCESHSDNWLTIHTQVPNYFHPILGETITSFQSAEFRISENLVTSLKKARLQRLSIDCSSDSSLCIDLIRQNSESLEDLYVGNLSQSDISMLILPLKDSGVLTYPRLKKLTVCRHEKDDFTVYEQFENDPFPALEQICSTNHLSHEAFAILETGNSHIRKLDFDITAEAMDVIVSNDLFTAGSYSALESICMSLHKNNMDYSFFGSEKPSRLIAMLLNLSPTTRHVHLSNFSFYFNDAVLPNIVQSDSLKTLDLNKIEFTMDQIVKLASKFKNLDRLTVALKDYPNGGLKAPNNNEVQRWKDELKAYTSNARTICIESTSFPNSRRGVEYVVLMASILEGVGKIAFKPYSSGNKLRNPLKNVQFALKRPVYKKCEHVHSVDFCMDGSL